MAITVLESNYVPEMLNTIRELKSKAVQVGIFGDGDGGDSFLLMIARVHEFGMTIHPKNGEALAIPLPAAKNTRPADHEDLFRPKGTNVLAKKKGKKDFTPYFVLVKSVTIPERSFMRSGYDKSKTELEKVIEKSISLALTMKITPEQAYERIGLFLVSSITRQIRQIKSPTNAPLTVAKKDGENNPLIDTGRLRQSITYRVVDV